MMLRLVISEGGHSHTILDRQFAPGILFYPTTFQKTQIMASPSEYDEYDEDNEGHPYFFHVMTAVFVISLLVLLPNLVPLIDRSGPSRRKRD
jgi:hypothetical protein